MSMIFDRTLSIVQGGMSVRRDKQAVSAGNIANLDTPGFRARQLNFGQILQDARGASPASMRLTSGLHMTPDGSQRVEAPEARVDLNEAAGRPDGTNVNLEQEMIQLNGNTMEYQALAGLLRRKMSMIRFAIDNS